MWNNYPSYQSGSYYNGGYSSPTYPQPSTPQQPTVNTNKLYANGIEDVRYRQLPANSDYIFLDNDKPLIYRKTTDATGKTDIQVFKITPHTEEKSSSSLDENRFVSVDRFEALENQFKELKESLGG